MSLDMVVHISLSDERSPKPEVVKHLIATALFEHYAAVPEVEAYTITPIEERSRDG